MARAIPSKIDGDAGDRRREEDVVKMNSERKEDDEGKWGKGGKETYAVASRPGRPGYCIVFSFGTNDLPCFPLYCRELLQPCKNT